MTQPNIDDIKLRPIMESLKLQKLEDSVYFSQEYSNYISNSRLGLLKKQGPKAFFDGFAAQTGYNSSFALGTMVHCMTLQPELFDICDVVDMPTAKLGGMADYLYQYYKTSGHVTDEQIIEASQKIDYYKASMNEARMTAIRKSCKQFWKDKKNFELNYNSEKTVLYSDAKMRNTAYGCIKALEDNRRIQQLLHPKDSLGNDIITQNEQAILCDVEVTVGNNEPFIVKLKAKLDSYSINQTDNIITINDVKTTIKNTNYFSEAIDAYDYDRELAFYAFLLSLCAKKYYHMDNPLVLGNFLVVSTIDPYYTNVTPMSDNLFKRGFEHVKELLRLACAYQYYGYEE